MATDIDELRAADAPARHRPSLLRRPWLWAAVAALVGLGVFVLVWFQPHKLFIDERVVESLPTLAPPPATDAPRPGVTQPQAAPTTAAPTPAPAPAGPEELARGEFISRDHGTSGVALVLELEDGSRFLRLESLDTSNGPDLFVYVTTNPADGPKGAFDDDFVNLGRLKGNQGDQNYELPTGTDLSRYSTVVIWCDRFNSPFGAADLVLA